MRQIDDIGDEPDVGSSVSSTIGTMRALSGARTVAISFLNAGLSHSLRRPRGAMKVPLGKSVVIPA
jgi:hypothetical protein